MTVTQPLFKQIAAEKVKQRNEKFIVDWLIPKDELPSADITDVVKWLEKSHYLSPVEHAITSANAQTIVRNIEKQVWSAVEVTSAFCHRASIAHQLTNCLSEVFFEKAFARAAELDAYQAETGKLVGPCHGLPISLKDNINISGEATTIGIVNFCFNPPHFEEDAVIVDLLRGLGAVFYVKTNVPVAMMMPESNNHIFGNTINPMNRALSSGGSSGGEAALIKLKGSVIGIGSDIGGSIRIPGSFQNLYALKPTFGRFPTFGCRSGLPGLESVNSVNGPLANSVESLEFYCEKLLSAEPWNHDAKTVELPWRLETTLHETLNIAILVDDGYVRPTPPIRRGISEVSKKLQDAGHDIIEWHAQDHYRLSQIISSFFLSDGGYHVKKEMEVTGETFFPYMEMYGTTPELTVSELWNLHVERTKLVNDYLKRWNDTRLRTKNGKPIDAIILPATPFAGNPNGKFHDYVGYTSPFNVLDYSACTFPVTRADKTKDLKDPVREYYSKTDENIANDYDPEESHGGAVALQCVGRKFQEEKVIQIVKVINKLVEYAD
jgi:amidase